MNHRIRTNIKEEVHQEGGVLCVCTYTGVDYASPSHMEDLVCAGVRENACTLYECTQ